MFHKFINIFMISVVVALAGVGCSHFASNERACEAAPPLFPLPYSFIGNVFQITPCTSIEPLRIETGIELNGVRGGVVDAINKKQLNSSIEQFARKMGCGNSYLDRFLVVQIENKGKIWGKDFENSNRIVIRNLREYTLNDKELREGCW